MIIDHNNKAYHRKWYLAGDANKDAYDFSVEMCENIVPLIDTRRDIVTINEGVCTDHAIVFIGNGNYEWLEGYSDLILICTDKDTCDSVAHLGKAVYVPIDAKKKKSAYKKACTKIQAELDAIDKGE